MFSALIRPLVWAAASLSVLATALAANTYRNTATGAIEVAPAPHPAIAKDDNPTVKPGLVNWHGSFADAKAASEKSGRPVLLFHMMGQLDKQFC
jgi:hypothetical protein